MKRYIKSTHEFKDDIILYNQLKGWVDSKGKPTTPYLND
jgi:hypothetical protein